jgi:serine protease Do
MQLFRKRDILPVIAIQALLMSIVVLVVGSVLIAQSSSHRNISNGSGGLDLTDAVRSNNAPIIDFGNLVENVTPAVVSIRARLERQPVSLGELDGPSTEFNPKRQTMFVSGSGFIIAPEGIVVTTRDVVADARSVTVTLSNGQSYPAKVLGTDALTNLAVLQISASHPVPYVVLGRSTNIAPGEWVIAVGSPFGLRDTVTAGVVSAVERNILDGMIGKLIQVDAPMNQGNSGGPLFDQHGKVVGVNTAIFSPSSGSIGISFAIPSNMVIRVVHELLANGKVVRGYLGVSAQQVTRPLAQAMGLPAVDTRAAGALIREVVPQSPAFRAGLVPGDVVISVDGSKVTSPFDFEWDVGKAAPGQDVRLKYFFDKRINRVSVTLAAAAPEQGASSAQAEEVRCTNIPSLGMTLAPITAATRAQLNLPENAQGAVVVHVMPNSQSYLGGLDPGDLLVAVGNQPVTGPSGVVTELQAASNHDDSAVALRVIRHGQGMFVGISLPAIR